MLRPNSLLCAFTCLFAFGSHAFSQDAAPAPRSAEAVVESLAGVSGVNPGMSREDLLKLVDTLTSSGDLESAERVASELVRDDRENLGALVALARVYEAQAVSLKAAGGDRQAEDKGRDAARTYLHAAPIALAAGHPGLAEQMYRRVLSFSRSNPDATLGLARVLAGTGRELPAIEQYREYLRMPLPGESGDARRRTHKDVDAKAQLELGRLHRQAKNLRQALATLQDAQRLDAEDPEIGIELAIVYRESGNLEKAQEEARRAIEKAPDNPDYHTTMATILQQRRSFSEAQAAAARAIQLSWEKLRANRDNQPLLQSLSGAYRLYQIVVQGRLAEAPRDPGLRLELAKAIAEQSAVEETLAMYRVLAVLSDTPPEARESVPLLEALAKAQAAVNKHADATATCRLLLQKDPANAVATELLGKLAHEGAPASAPAGAASR